MQLFLRIMHFYFFFQICENLSGFVMVALVRHIGNQEMEEGTLEKRRRRKNEEEGEEEEYLYC